MGCGFAGDLAVAGLDLGCERSGVGGVVGHEVAEGLDGDRCCGGGGASGLQLGLRGESVEEVVEVGGLEDVEEL